MAILLLDTLAFACISFASPLSPQLLHPTAPADSIDNSLLLPSNGFLKGRDSNSSDSSSQIDAGYFEYLNSSVIPSSNVPPIRPKGDYWCNREPVQGPTTTYEGCVDALRSAKSLEFPDLFTHQVTFGPREDLIYNVGLPRAYMSLDGSCSIALTLKPSANSARAAPHDVVRATLRLIEICFRDGQTTTRGHVRNFGGDDNLVVSFGAPPFNDVECMGRVGGPGIIESCRTLEDTMEATMRHLTFGNPNPQMPDVVLPYTKQDGDRCALSVTMSPQTTHRVASSWYTVWLAVVAIYSQCIRNGRTGAWTDLGTGISDRGYMQVGINDLQVPGHLASNFTTS